MERFDRRTLLARAGRFAVGTGVALAVGGGVGAAWAAAERRIRQLRKGFKGDVLVPGNAGYRNARRLFNTRFDAVRPTAVALCETVADVRKAVRWGRRHNVRMAARSGGHSYGGYSTTRGLIVDVGRLNRIRVDVAAGTARVGAGARLIDVYAALWEQGVTIPAGSCPTVGIAGLALGGGHGLSSRKLGLTCDNLLGATMVTAAGKRVRCSDTQNDDLYWALRGGGGGNFGIVTELTFRVHPVSDVTTFHIQWPWDQAAMVVEAWQAFAPHAPDELFSLLGLSAGGAGGPRVGSSGQFFGTEGELTSLLEPLTSVGTPTTVRVVPRTYMEAVFHWANCGSLESCRPGGASAGATRSPFRAKSDYGKKPMSAAGIQTMLEWVERRQRAQKLAGGGITLDSYGGAINRVAKGSTAFVHRDALFSMQYLAFWNRGDPAPVVDANRRWIRRFHRAMRPFVSGAAYQNYIDPDLKGWKRAYYGSNYRRLVEVKRKYDPDNVFRFRQSIR
ncbi:MAG: FAD-binding oxidoreductase [Gaiellaceae bacterium]